ncbi:MAG: TPM domain-containing protein [Verrucomicrobiota bacterium]
MEAKEFLNLLRHDEIVAAIRRQERRTSGEIRVCICHRRVDDPVQAAQSEFERLGMTRTQERNGVLIFVAPLSRNFAVIGDAGIHARCGDSLWPEVSQFLARQFAEGRFTEGIVEGIQAAGDKLAEHFPPRGDDRNELPDDVVEN